MGEFRVQEMVVAEVELFLLALHQQEMGQPDKVLGVEFLMGLEHIKVEVVVEPLLQVLELRPLVEVVKVLSQQ